MNAATMRPLTVNLGPISRSDGSAEFAQGRTVVIAGVFGPGECRPQKEKIDRAVVEVSYRSKTGLPTSGVEGRAREELLRGCIEGALMTSLHPRTSICLSLQESLLNRTIKRLRPFTFYHTLDDDGCELSCCLNSACLALVDASLSMKFLFAAVTVGLMQNEENEEEVITLDPSKKDLSKSKASVTFVFESTKKDILATNLNFGKMSEKTFQKCLAIAKEGSESVFEFYRATLKRKFSKELENK